MQEAKIFSIKGAVAELWGVEVVKFSKNAIFCGTGPRS